MLNIEQSSIKEILMQAGPVFLVCAIIAMGHSL